MLRRVAVGKTGESLVLDPIPQIDDEELLDERGHFIGADGFPDLSGDGLGVVHAATEHDVIAVHGGAVFDFHAGAHHADVADVMLGAGILAAGEVDVHGLIEDHLAGKVVAEGDGLGLGIRGGELASLAAGAGDEAAGEGVVPVVEAGRLDGGDGGLEVFLGDARDDEVLPDGEADLAAAELIGDIGEC